MVKRSRREELAPIEPETSPSVIDWSQYSFERLTVSEAAHYLRDYYRSQLPLRDKSGRGKKP